MSRPKRHATATAHTLSAVDESLAAASDDELLRVDPSAMTERQQLAFLLRATAHAAATASDDSSSDSSAGGSSSDEAARRIQRNSRTSLRSANGPATSSSRSRLSKSAGKLTQGPLSDDDSKKQLSPRHAAATAKKELQPLRKRLKVKTATRSLRGTVQKRSADVADAGADVRMADGDADSPLDKTSPSSSSDVLRMPAFSDSSSSGPSGVVGGDFWRSHCALCSDNAKLAAAYGVDALFLCPSCDRKYPTQRALGLV